MAPHPVRACSACKGLNMHTLVTVTCMCVHTYTHTHTHTHRLFVTILSLFLVFPQNKLLGNFFHMYSKSTHRLVEFVADRISSNLIKDLRHKALPSALHRCEGEVCQMAILVSFRKLCDCMCFFAFVRQLCCVLPLSGFEVIIVCSYPT